MGKVLLIILFVSTAGCNHTYIQSGDKINSEISSRIHSFVPMASDEKIISLSSTSGAHKSGSFFTEKKVVYYQFGKSKAENRMDTARFSDILAIDTNFNPTGDFMAPRMRITRNDHHLFMLYADGSKSEVSGFFGAIISQWYRVNKHRKTCGNKANYN